MILSNQNNNLESKTSIKNQSYSNINTKSYTNTDTRSFSNIDNRSFTTIKDNNGTRRIITKNKPLVKASITTTTKSNNTMLHVGLSIFSLIILIIIILVFTNKKNQDYV